MKIEALPSKPLSMTNIKLKGCSNWVMQENKLDNKSLYRILKKCADTGGGLSEI